jgi:hypothetical protein
MSNRTLYQQHTRTLEEIVGKRNSHPGKLRSFQSQYGLYNIDLHRLFAYVQSRMRQHGPRRIRRDQYRSSANRPVPIQFRVDGAQSPTSLAGGRYSFPPPEATHSVDARRSAISFTDLSFSNVNIQPADLIPNTSLFSSPLLPSPEVTQPGADQRLDTPLFSSPALPKEMDSQYRVLICLVLLTSLAKLHGRVRREPV